MGLTHFLQLGRVVRLLRFLVMFASREALQFVQFDLPPIWKISSTWRVMLEISRLRTQNQLTILLGNIVMPSVDPVVPTGGGVALEGVRHGGSHSSVHHSQS